jgi:hypothetical protein
LGRHHPRNGLSDQGGNCDKIAADQGTALGPISVEPAILRNNPMQSRNSQWTIA